MGQSKLVTARSEPYWVLLLTVQLYSGLCLAYVQYILAVKCCSVCVCVRVCVLCRDERPRAVSGANIA